MPQRRTFGSIEKRPQGHYRARYAHPHIPFKDDGRRNWIYAPGSFRTKYEAEDWLSGVRADISRGVWKSPEDIAAARVEATALAARKARTFGNYATEWLKARRLTPETRRSYESHLRNHLDPRWGDTRLGDIVTVDIRAWLATAQNGSSVSFRRAFELFRTVLGTAADDGLIEVNPCPRNMLATVQLSDTVRVKKDGQPVSKREPRALSREDLDAVAAQLPHPLSLMVLLSGLVGFRSGEVRALRGKDVAETNGGLTVNVSRAITGRGRHFTEGVPKTPQSIRPVPVPATLADDMRTLVDSVGTEGLLFPSSRNADKYMPERTYQDGLSSAGKRAGILHVTPHDLRHTAASLMQAAGASAEEVATILGHTTTTMTRRYTHMFESQLRGAVDRAATLSQRASNVADLAERRRAR